MPPERIRVIAADDLFIIGDCFYGECSPVSGKVYNEFFDSFEPIPRAREKLWRYTQTEHPAEGVVYWTPLPEIPKS